MKSCSITFKIKDYFPKIDTIPFEEYVCIIINKDFNEKIPLIEKDYNTCQHQINNVNSDLKYKLHLVNINDFSLIGICEVIIPYSIITQIDTPGTFIKEQQLKLFIDLKTKRKLFGTIISSGDIYLYISAEVFVSNQISYEHKKKKNVLKDKTGFRKDYIKNILGNNNINNMAKKNYRIIKTDKDSLRNECKTFTCLKNAARSSTNNTISNDFYNGPLSQERKERQLNKHQSNPVNTSSKTTITIENNKNLRGQNQKIKKIQTQRKKLTILDLMEQKYQSKRQLNINNKINNILNINNTISKNNSPKDSKDINLDNKENIGLNNEKNFYFFSDKSKNHTNNYGTILKNVFSPINKTKNLITNDRMNYIYKKKSAQKIRTKISDSNIFNYNSSSPYSISNLIFKEEEKGHSTVKKLKSCSSKKIKIQKNIDINAYQINTNININDISDTNFITSFDEKQKLLVLDRTILEKGVLLRNDFQNQLNYSHNQSKYVLENTFDDIYNNTNNSNKYSSNNAKNMIGNINVRYNRSQKDFHKINKQLKPSSSNIKIELDSSKNNTNNMTPCSSNQNLFLFTQEDLKNNILNLLDFYSLLKKKIIMLKDNINKNKQKLIIKKEKFNHQLKKNNRLTQKIISVESKIILHATINCSLNEQIILPLMKIKKNESSIYQNIFGLKCHDYDIMRYKKREKNRLFEEQNIMHLLLIIMKNMVEHYGNVSHVYHDDINRKKILQILLYKYEIIEKKEENLNLHNNLDMNINNKKKFNKFNKSQFTPGQIIDDEFLNKFKIIREVEEDKEYDDSDEEENTKKEIKNNNDLDILDLENSENFINEKFENGASKNENEKSNKKNNQHINFEENFINNNKSEIINKILLDEFPKNYPNENKFIYKNKNEYYFGENIVNVDMNNNNLEFIINNEKYNFEDFLKFFTKNNNFMDINENDKEEQINGIESTTTAVGTEKSENLIRDKISKSNSKNNDIGDEENFDNYNSNRLEKRMKRKISYEEGNENPEYKELNMIKNGADSNSEVKK